MSRRQFIGRLGLATLGGGLAVIAGPEIIKQVLTAKTVSADATPGASASSTASPIESQAPQGIEVGGITLIGIPASVDASRVDTAKKPFINKIGKGTQMAFAEPGGLWVGPDFGYTGKDNPFGANPQGWPKMYDAKGNIQPISPVTQEVFTFDGEASWNVSEGGWALFSAGQMSVKAGDFEIDMPHQDGNTYFLVIRGLYGDMKQNTDKNTIAKITNYVPGATLAMRLQSANETNIAFLSEGQLEQMAQTAHSGGSNTGDGGSSKLTLVMLDLNTGAYDVAQQTLGRNQKANKNWTQVGSNWSK